MHPSRAPNWTLHRKGKMAAWPSSRLWKVCGATLFQMIVIVALLATVLGDCGPPPNLLFAFPTTAVTETNFVRGATLRYTCRPGYSRNSSFQLLTCDDGGFWRYEVFCAKKRCRNPGDLPNGLVDINTDFSFGSQIEFSCLEGYILIGATTSYCDIQEKGVDWSNPLPVCIIAKCEPPPAISNGKHNGREEDVYTYGSSVTYSCDPHFSLLGKASISCTVENKTIGVWSPSPPTCKKITCPPPKVPNAAIISGFGPTYTYKDSIVYNCKNGYILRGNSLIHCEDDNEWHPSPPTCELNSCVNLPDIPNASWDTHNHYRATKYGMYNIGTVLRYHCNHGYRPTGDEPTTVTCQEDLTWTPFKGCESCHTPPSIAHGRYKPIQTYYRTEFVYECDEGYTLVGQAKFSCRSSGSSLPAPQCKALCSNPKIENGKLSVHKYQYTEGENVTVQCNPGYAVVGSQNISCSENRTWYPEVPKCEWEVPEGCEQVLAGRHLMQCLPSPQDVKMALDIYKLSLEIEQLEQERHMQRNTREHQYDFS
ncbi:C4b-binding protein alpha chain [Trichechus manatus latirostris]|uniref:C4b-binding protein alpha chain n=1 Tax=Trichechus manatus latirostris TaxID=127582 RepID=A0A2Y9FZP0_TRIMA|nr:C4b-binding protein alpha chain [Trichechus manatus latirostris]